MRYNFTNFTSREFAANLILAMAVCLKQGHSQYVENRKGERFLRVAIKTGQSYQGSKVAQTVWDFEFIARNGQNVTSEVHNGLLMGGHELFSDYWDLLSRCWELPPRWAGQQAEAVKNAQEAYSKEHERREAKALGATHTAMDEYGNRLYIRFKPRILGMFGGRMEVVMSRLWSAGDLTFKSLSMRRYRVHADRIFGLISF